MLGVPDQLGGFTLLSELGRGGMGVVYLARQDALGRLVAIKLLSAEGDTYAERLRHEAHVLSGLQSPHVVSVIDVGEYDQRPYLVMPYLGGGSLAEVLRRDRHLTAGQTAGVLAAVADALAAAHDRGILHRDVKPNNILFSAAGDPYLSDFGIATGSSAARTTSGELLGTLGYFAPESISGAPASAASDVYGLGVVGYVALSGRPPFVADNVLAALEAARSGRVEPLSELVPDAPESLTSLISSCLAFDPADRPADLRALAEQLRHSVTPERVAPMPDLAMGLLSTDPVRRPGHGPNGTMPETIGGPRGRRRVVVVAGVAAACLAIAGVSAAVGLNQPKSKHHANTASPSVGSTVPGTEQDSPSAGHSSTAGTSAPDVPATAPVAGVTVSTSAKGAVVSGKPVAPSPGSSVPAGTLPAGTTRSAVVGGVVTPLVVAPADPSPNPPDQTSTTAAPTTKTGKTKVSHPAPPRQPVKVGGNHSAGTTTTAGQPPAAAVSTTAPAAPTTVGAVVAVAPTLQAIPPQSNGEMEDVSVGLEGGAADTSFKYEMSSGSLPAGVNFNPTTGVISGKISADAANVTTTYTDLRSQVFTATFVVRDGGQVSSPQTLTWTVQDNWISMPDYVTHYGCGDTCNGPPESQPNLADLLSSHHHPYTCHVRTADDSPKWLDSTIFAQTPPATTPILWGGDGTTSFVYFHDTQAECP